MGQDHKRKSVYTEDDIRRVLGREMQPSVQVERRLDEVYAQVRQERASGRKKSFRGACCAAGAAAAVFAAGVFCVSNPALAAKIPVLGHIFEQIGGQASFPGDYSSVGTVLQTEQESMGAQQEAGAAAENGTKAAAQASGTAAENGTEAAAQVSGAAAENGAQEQEGQTGSVNPQTASVTAQTTSAYTQTVGDLTVSLSEVYGNSEALYLTLQLVSENGFEPERCAVMENGKPVLALKGEADFSFLEEPLPFLSYLDGSFLDEHTYAGMMRLDFQDYGGGSSDFPDAAEQEGSYAVSLRISQLIGHLADGYSMSIYEAAGVEQPSGEELSAMSDEEWNAYMNELSSKVPDFNSFPNKYEDFWYDGPFEFEVPVTLDGGQTAAVEINEQVAEGYELLSVSRTPFELVVNEEITSSDEDLMLQVLDADGKRLDTGSSGGSVNVLACGGHDLSRADLYYLTWKDYETYTKGSYWEEHETDADGRTLKEVLEEHSIYHREVVFDQ